MEVEAIGKRLSSLKRKSRKLHQFDKRHYR
jgi:hypothetical protein